MGNFGENSAERPKTRETMEKMKKTLIKGGLTEKEASKKAAEVARRFDQRKGYGTP